ncbi:adenine deaminase [Lactobacillus sp. Sy-1]|uniref:adenine deaminase n=1 Tax=Lactobacillus sp. Sy-1 TaxID=2109645 RepID=UPI001C58A574|nr:adenine deaminase [Lactobacillus sp. Sy-1]MBW1605116.1 adenine deaminase [Lactobacillus sp. Sy-1]
MKTVDLLVQGANILNVFARRFEPNQLWIDHGRIVATGDQPLTAKKTYDAEQQYVVPGFIDSHVHVESSLVVPSELAKVILPKGTTTIFTDPHEIANVVGIPGVQYMINDARQTPLSVNVMLPSSVPATPFENNGATLDADSLRPLYDEPEVKGLAEVMDYPAVLNREPGIMQKINDALSLGYQVDGHGAGFTRTMLDTYRQVGINTDHESVDMQQIKDRLAEGFNIFLREGTVERDLLNTIPVVNEGNAHQFSFCTDDKFVNTILEEGGIDHCIRLAIQSGIRPETAYTMASYNAAIAHRITNLGSLATNAVADLIVIGDPYKVDIQRVMKDGKFITEADLQTKPLKFSANTMHHHVNKTDLVLPLKGEHPICNVIGIQNNHIETDHLIQEVPVADGHFIADLDHDVLKMVVVERHHDLGTVGVGLVHGFNLKAGAVATTIAHDSHNLVVVGTNDDAIYRAIQEVTEVGGGISVVDDQKPLATMPLSVAGLMSSQDWKSASAGLTAVTKAYHQISEPIDFNPFITLSFLTLTVIPTIKLTDQGLYDFANQKFIHVQSN